MLSRNRCINRRNKSVLIISDQNKLIALDAKFNFDSNALYQQNSIVELRDLNEEDLPK